MISVLATIEIGNATREEFLTLFTELVPKVQAELGCLEYGPWVDLPNGITQTDPRANVVVAIEKWESLEALEAHLMAPHMIEFRKASEPMGLKIDLQILAPA